MVGTFELQYLNAFNAGKTDLNKQNIDFQKTSSLISSIAKTIYVFFATDQNAALCIEAFNALFNLNNLCIA